MGKAGPKASQKGDRIGGKDSDRKTDKYEPRKGVDHLRENFQKKGAKITTLEDTDYMIGWLSQTVSADTATDAAIFANIIGESFPGRSGVADKTYIELIVRNITNVWGGKINNPPSKSGTYGGILDTVAADVHRWEKPLRRIRRAVLRPGNPPNYRRP